MAKGTIGKQNVINKIKQAFGADFIGEYDKKIYVWTTLLMQWLRPEHTSLQKLLRKKENASTI